MSNEIKNALVILRRKQLEARIKLARSTIYDRLNPKSSRYDPTFPRQISLGTKAVGWVEAEVDTWLTAQIEKSRNAAAA